MALLRTLELWSNAVTGVSPTAELKQDPENLEWTLFYTIRCRNDATIEEIEKKNLLDPFVTAASRLSEPDVCIRIGDGLEP